MRIPAQFDFARRRVLAARSRTMTHSLTQIFRALGLGMLLVVTAWCYAPVLQSDLVWEDATRIGMPAPTGTAAYRDPINYENALGSGPERYRPLTQLSLRWDLKRGGRPFDFHASSLALHLINVLLVYAIARRLRLGRGASWLAALLFGIYPLCNLAVAHVGAREELLAFMLMGCAFLLHTSKGWLGKPPAVILFTLALLARPAAAGMGLVFVAWELGRGTRKDDRWPILGALARLAPYAIVGALMLAIVRRHFGTLGLMSGHEADFRTLIRTIPVAFYKMVQLVLRPYAYAQPSVLTFRSQNLVTWVLSWTDPRLLMGSVFCLGYAAALWVTWRARGRALVPLAALAALWLPLDSLFFGRAFDLTHNMYAPSAAFLILLALVVERAGFEGRAGQVRRGVVGGAAVIVALSFVVATQARIAVWRDEVNVYLEALAKYPSIAPLHAGYGTALARRGDELKAVDVLHRAVELDGGQVVPHFNLGLVYSNLGRYGEAALEFRRVTQLEPKDAEAWHRWGQAELRQGNAGDAVEAESRAATLDPARPAYHVGVSEARLAHGDLGEAESEAQRAIELDGRGALGYAAMSEVLRTAGRMDEALSAGRNAVALDPASAVAALKYGRALAAAGRQAEALEQIGRYVQLEPHPDKGALELEKKLKAKMGS